jgi:hypothetical protein
VAECLKCGGIQVGLLCALVVQGEVAACEKEVRNGGTISAVRCPRMSPDSLKRISLFSKWRAYEWRRRCGLGKECRAHFCGPELETLP